jgi:dTDP-4-amino-4,6-dideoxygalactose transaminase
MDTNVPFLDLKKQFEAISQEIEYVIKQVLDSCAFAGGPFVAKFEREFADFCDCKHTIGVSSGTSALWTALRSVRVGPGDEVITVPNTFIATAEAISMVGAIPKFVDIDEKTYTMDASALDAAITPHSRAVIPVHLFGQTADMDSIMEVAKSHKLWVIEDACQAHGAMYKGRRAGSIGDAGCFSFYPGKNLGAYGEAGAVVTNNDEIAETVRMLRDHGQYEKYKHSVVGWNDRMDGFQGAILSVKLKYLEEWNRSRRTNALLYKRELQDLPLVLPFEAEYGEHVYHVFSVRTANRDRLLEHLTHKGINCGIHYPVPIHLQDAYRSLELLPGTLPIAERCAEEFLSLPMFAELTAEQIQHVSKCIREEIS